MGNLLLPFSVVSGPPMVQHDAPSLATGKAGLIDITEQTSVDDVGYSDHLPCQDLRGPWATPIALATRFARVDGQPGTQGAGAGLMMTRLRRAWAQVTGLRGDDGRSRRAGARV